MDPQAPTLVYASGGRRMLSVAIDYFAIQLLAAPFLGNASRRVAENIADGKAPDAQDVVRGTVVTVLVIVAYFTAMHAWRGVTFGKMAARTVLVNDDGSRVGPSTAFVRAVAQAVLVFVAPFLFFVPLVFSELRPFWNRRRQTLHDTIARTVVVRADSLNAARDET